MQIRNANRDEMLKLWGYQRGDKLSPTARFFYDSISSGNAVFWTLDNDGELIGELYVFLDIEFDRDFADGHETAYLCAFRVKKEYRRHGLGSRLMEAAFADLRKKGFFHATIGVSEEHNERMYRHMGFTRQIKDCYFDPCAMDENMQPTSDEGYKLLIKDL